MSSKKNTGEYRRLWRGWYINRRSTILVIFGLMACVAIASALYAKGIQVIVSAMETRDANVMYWGPVIVIALSVSKAVSQYLNELISNRLISGVGVELRTQMFASLVSADLARLAAVAPTAQATKFSVDIDLVRKASLQMIKGFTAILIIIFTFVVMLTIDWSLTLGLIAVFVIALVPVNLIGKKVRIISRKGQIQIGEMLSSVTESLQGIRMARTYQLEEPLEKQAGKQFQRHYKLVIDIVKWRARIAPVMEILVGASVAILLGVVGWRLQNDSITLADFMALLTGLGVASNPARRLGAIYATMQQGRAALERVFELFDAENLIADVDDAIEMVHSKGAIKFENVTFKYPDGVSALANISLDIAPGKKIAFVGRSGAGKSTIFNLLPRLYDPIVGSITLDGIDLKQIKIADLRRQIAVVSQETVLLSGSVAENIGYGRKVHTREDVIEAAKSAAAHDFISALPDGYDSKVGAGASVFSGGEKQRLSIARAILRQAPILLLDEPTSALDAESEATIRAALDRLAKGRTTLIIAHRLATILDADLIVVMDDGRIVQTGSHDELLAEGGLYSNLYRLQFAS